MNFVVIGARGKDRVVEKGVFGEIAEGRVENAVYLSPRPLDKAGKLAFRLAGTRYRPLWLKCMLKAPWEVHYDEVAPLLKRDEPNCVVFCPTTYVFERIRPALLRDLRKKGPKCMLAIYLVDGMKRIMEKNGCSQKKITDSLKQFDLVLTYDRHDAEAYHYDYMELPVWSAHEVACDRTEYDVYFCGRGKGREGMLAEIDAHLTSAGATVQFAITEGDLRGSPLERFSVDAWRPYPEVVEEMKKARCVLEILAESNTSSTLRYKEAVIYNKKLLTNNPDLQKMPYYDARWMRYFERASDIDVKWLLDDEAVDYGYRGDFSARHFLKEVEARLSGERAAPRGRRQAK